MGDKLGMKVNDIQTQNGIKLVRPSELREAKREGRESPKGKVMDDYVRKRLILNIKKLGSLHKSMRTILRKQKSKMKESESDQDSGSQTFMTLPSELEKEVKTKAKKKINFNVRSKSISIKKSPPKDQQEIITGKKASILADIDLNDRSRT